MIYEIADKREAWRLISGTLGPDAKKVWHLRHLPRKPRHATEIDFVAAHAWCRSWSLARYDAACVAIVEALLTHPDAAAMLKPAEIEATDAPALKLA